jgi:hypothetical protein
MKELSMNILDILHNSVHACPKNIYLTIVEDSSKDLLQFTIKDDGKGMSEEFASKVFDPFTTTSSTKNVGLGLPFLKIQCEMCNGSAHLSSKENVGTEVQFVFQNSHIDRPPMGDLAGTLTIMFTMHHRISFFFKYCKDHNCFEVSTDLLKSIMQDVPLHHPKVAKGIEEYIKTNLIELQGGY